MKGLLFAVLVFSLCSAGLGLLCVQCTNSTATFCSGTMKNCTVDDLCVSTITQTTAADGQKTFTFDRDCGDADQCNTTGSMTSLISTEIQSTCCNTDACTPPQPSRFFRGDPEEALSGETSGDGGLAPFLGPLVPKVKKDQNRIQCPVCLAHSTGQCNVSNIKPCTGDEKYCAVYVVKSDLDRTIIMGCASESFCHTAQSQKLLNGKITQVMARCLRSKSDGPRARVFHLLPVLLGTHILSLM